MPRYLRSEDPLTRYATKAFMKLRARMLEEGSFQEPTLDDISLARYGFPYGYIQLVRDYVFGRENTSPLSFLHNLGVTCSTTHPARLIEFLADQNNLKVFDAVLTDHEAPVLVVIGGNSHPENPSDIDNQRHWQTRQFLEDLFSEATKRNVALALYSRYHDGTVFETRGRELWYRDADTGEEDFRLPIYDGVDESICDLFLQRDTLVHFNSHAQLSAQIEKTRDTVWSAWNEFDSGNTKKLAEHFLAFIRMHYDACKSLDESSFSRINFEGIAVQTVDFSYLPLDVWRTKAQQIGANYIALYPWLPEQLAA